MTLKTNSLTTVVFNPNLMGENILSASRCVLGISALSVVMPELKIHITVYIYSQTNQQ